MARSLYLKFVFTFISGVMVSLFASYFIATVFFHDNIVYQDRMESTTNHVIELLDIVEGEQLPRLLELLDDLSVDAVLLNESYQTYTDSMSTEWITDEMIYAIRNQAAEKTLTFPVEQHPSIRLVGTMIEFEGQQQYLFIIIDFEQELLAFQTIIFLVLLLVLLIGSIFIALVSRYFVSSIQSVTNAAGQLATGDFTVRLKTNKKDEIGKLTKSFNQLATSLSNMEKVREDFVSNVSHEIQSPLTSIKGYTRALKDGLVAAEEQKEYLEVIYQETDRLSRLSDNLLKMASLDSEHHPYHPDHYRLDEQLRRAVLATEPLWQEKEMKMELRLTQQRIYADQDLFEQVWLNLITNAIKYSERFGKVIIDLDREDMNVKVKITDEGIGIPKEELPYIFDRFYKVDKARSSETKGNGLGLSIVKKIVTLHQASIDVESKIEEGSCFIVTIPYTEPKK